MRFLAILADVAWPRAQLLDGSISLKFSLDRSISLKFSLDGSISLKFSLETSLESESFAPLIEFLVFLVRKLRAEINKLIV